MKIELNRFSKSIKSKNLKPKKNQYVTKKTPVFTFEGKSENDSAHVPKMLKFQKNNVHIFSRSSTAPPMASTPWTWTRPPSTTYIRQSTPKVNFYFNKPERVFGLQVRCSDLDIFKILGIFWIFL